MRFLHTVPLAVSFLLASHAPAYFPTDFDSPLTTIAFGSCNRSDLPQPLWEPIAESKPDLWIWMGDNVYADTRDMAHMKNVYDSQFNHPGYTAFRKQVPILGTWDDHDYGENNAGGWYPPKAKARDLALGFWEVPGDDPRWSREGVYGSYTFGPKGKQTKIILLDGRYFATEPDMEDSDLLGEVQWEWLENELKTTTAQLNIIVSGIQFLPADHRHEKWSRYPKSKGALLDLIQKEKIPGVIFLSGDRHIHEISVLNDPDIPYPLVEITSSGMTHPWVDFPGEPNELRSGEVFSEKGFGLLRIDWNEKPVQVTAEIRDENNEAVRKLTSFH